MTEFFAGFGIMACVVLTGYLAVTFICFVISNYMDVAVEKRTAESIKRLHDRINQESDIRHREDSYLTEQLYEIKKKARK